MSDIQNNNQYRPNNGPYIIIIILLIIIAVLAFFLGKGTGGNSGENTNFAKNIEITIIDDERCMDCATDELFENLSQIPFIAEAKINKIDFSDPQAEIIMKANDIARLPGILFNTNNIPDPDLKQYLMETSGGMYSLNIGASFDPYEEKSERGFSLLNQEVLDEIKENSRILGDENSEIIWVEYSDMDCTYCKKLHNEGTHDELFDAFGDKLSLAYQYFAIFNKTAPEVFECIAEQKGTQVMYDTISKAYKEEVGSKNAILDLVDGIDKDALNACIDNGEFAYKIDFAMQTGSSVFGITGTPGNILINQKTLEYAKLPGAYPVSEFKSIINSLLME